MVGSKMLILFFTIIVMSSINITFADETTKHTEVMESTMLSKLIHNIGDLFYGREIEESRTFGRIKKLQAALLPLMFKLGVLATVVKIILLLSLKAVIIGKILLFINFGFIVAKIASWKSHEHHNSWQPPAWPQMAPIWYPLQQSQPIHVHIHSHDKEQPHYAEHDQTYQPYSNSGPPGHYDRYDSGLVGKPNNVNYDGQYTERRPSRYYSQS